MAANAQGLYAEVVFASALDKPTKLFKTGPVLSFCTFMKVAFLRKVTFERGHFQHAFKFLHFQLES